MVTSLSYPTGSVSQMYECSSLITQFVKLKLLVAPIEDIDDLFDHRAILHPKFHDEIALRWVRFY
jgi:hypothetical protein